MGNLGVPWNSPSKIHKTLKYLKMKGQVLLSDVFSIKLWGLWVFFSRKYMNKKFMEIPHFKMTTSAILKIQKLKTMCKPILRCKNKKKYRSNWSEIKGGVSLHIIQCACEIWEPRNKEKNIKKWTEKKTCAKSYENGYVTSFFVHHVVDLASAPSKLPAESSPAPILSLYQIWFHSVPYFRSGRP